MLISRGNDKLIRIISFGYTRRLRTPRPRLFGCQETEKIAKKSPNCKLFVKLEAIKLEIRN